MRFALLGDHPDGLDMARALAASGRHEIAAYTGPPIGADYLKRWGLSVPTVPDLEEVLADPSIAAAIVAGSPAVRAAQLRRALQSERHVLCVHPPDGTPDTAYEANLMQGDTGCVLLPLLPETLHPAVVRMTALADDGGPQGLRLVEVERWSAEAVLLDADTPGHKPGLPGWDVLRAVGGEIAEVFAFAAAEEVEAAQALLVAGRFEGGGLFQVSLLPQQSDPRWRLTLVTGHTRAELVFAEGWPGPGRLTWRDAGGEGRAEAWQSWDPWPALVEVFEAAVARHAGQRDGATKAVAPTWQDAVRCLELDDAARRSVERRRSSTLEYPTATEEASFKGTMTLVGCGMVWISLILLVASHWFPWLGWVIGPLFGVFLALQMLRWALPPRPEESPEKTGQAAEPAGRQQP